MARRVRSDAVRNYESLVSSAKESFMRAGVYVPLEEIARTAGVSIGTLYNHFKNREALLAAVLPGVVASQRDRIVDAVGTDGTAGERLARYLNELFAVQREDRLLSDVLATNGAMPDDAKAVCGELIAIGSELLVEVAASSDDCPFDDPKHLAALIVANSVVQRSGPPEGWDDYLTAVARRVARTPSVISR